MSRPPTQGAAASSLSGIETLLYACATWSLTADHYTKLDGVHRLPRAASAGTRRVVRAALCPMPKPSSCPNARRPRSPCASGVLRGICHAHGRRPPPQARAAGSDGGGQGALGARGRQGIPPRRGPQAVRCCVLSEKITRQQTTRGTHASIPSCLARTSTCLTCHIKLAKIMISSCTRRTHESLVQCTPVSAWLCLAYPRDKTATLEFIHTNMSGGRQVMGVQRVFWACGGHTHTEN